MSEILQRLVMDYGKEEGDTCNREGCQGTMNYPLIPEGCTCHLHPPCPACQDALPYCDICGMSEEDDCVEED